MRCEAYMAKILNDLTINNPTWIESLKKDKDFFHEDGSPVTDMSQEKINEKILSFVNNVEFKGYEVDWEVVKDLFVITEEDLKQFIIQDK
jgi:hypothetical protein